MSETLWICRNANGRLYLSVTDPQNMNGKGEFRGCESTALSGFGNVSSLPNQLFWDLHPGQKMMVTVRIYTTITTTTTTA